MSKLIPALNAMISNPDKIADVRKSRDWNEFYFRYLGKQVWSIWRDRQGGEYVVYYYPKATSPDEDLDDPDVEMIRYSTEEEKNREAHETFSALFNLLQEKHYGVEKALDEILQDAAVR